MALVEIALNVITTVKYDVSLINAVNRMTFLFDANWQAMGNTLPIAFFFVKSFKEIMQSEVSQKTLLFYNSQVNTNENSVAGGLLGVVSDNIIAKPKKYQMEILIPRTLDVYLKQSMFNRRVSFGDLYHNTTLTGLETAVSMGVETISALLRILNSTAFSDLTDISLNKFVSDCVSGAVEESNKASFEAMWQNRGILRMKCWNGWKYKYVSIEDYQPSKAGDEDDFYTATLILTEMPILTVRNEGNKLTSVTSKLGSFLKVDSIKNMLDRLEDSNLFGKMEA